MADRDVTIGIIGHDRTGHATRSAEQNFEHLRGKVRDVTTSVDRNSNALQRFATRVSRSVKKVTDGIGDLPGKLVKSFSKMIGVAPELGAIILAASAALVPALAAAITSGLLLGVGAGLLGIAVLALKQNERIKKAFTKTGSTIKSVLTKAAEPLVGPMVNALVRFQKLAKELAAPFRSIFKSLVPVVPLLANGFSGFMKEVIVGLKDSMPGITAAFRGLATALPIVGKYVGDFFRALAANPEVIETTTQGIMKFIFGPLKLLGPLLSGLNVLFGVQTNLMKLYGIIGKDLWTKLITWLDNGSGEVKRLKEAWAPLWAAIKNVWDKLKEFAAAKTDAEIVAKFLALVKAIKDVWAPLKNFIGRVWDECWADIKAIWNEKVVPWWNDTAKPWLKQAFSGAMNEAVAMMKAKAKAELAKLPGAIIGALASLPGKITAALADRMGDAGWSIGRSFVDGMVAAINAGKGRVTGVGSSVGRAGAAAAKAAAANFSSGGSWAPAVTAAQFAGGTNFAMAGGGTSRTGGPVEVNQTLNVSLDGAPFRSFVASAIAESERRQATRAKVGRR